MRCEREERSKTREANDERRRDIISMRERRREDEIYEIREKIE